MADLPAQRSLKEAESPDTYAYEGWREWEARVLSPQAVHGSNSKGRKHKETEHPYRSPFQRDRDRIIHSRAFRRLEYKTQVFVNHEGDHFRTRLTHTLEGAQIARTLARTLRLNEDLTEAVILAHDLGHTPFGHSGERTLGRLMENHGGFEHNRQSVRIVETLEDRYSEFPGLNLTFEVLEGLHKHPTPGQEGPPYHSLEAQIVDVADEIAYTNHDVDDGLESGLITWDQLKKVTIFGEALGDAEKAIPDMSPRLRRYQVVRVLINKMVSDLVNSMQNTLKEKKLETSEDIRKSGKGVASFSPGMKKRFYEMKEFLYRHFYQHSKVVELAEKHDKILEVLINGYMEDPSLMPEKFAKRAQEADLHRVVCDYVAGMTDRYALDKHSQMASSK